MNAPWWSHNLLPCLDIQQLDRATGRWLGKSPVGKFRMTPGCHHGCGIRWCTEQLKEKQFGEKKKDVKKHIPMWAIGLGTDSVIQHGAVEVPGSSGEFAVVLQKVNMLKGVCALLWARLNSSARERVVTACGWAWPSSRSRCQKLIQEHDPPRPLEQETASGFRAVYLWGHCHVSLPTWKC